MYTRQKQTISEQCIQAYSISNYDVLNVTIHKADKTSRAVGLHNNIQ